MYELKLPENRLSKSFQVTVYITVGILGHYYIHVSFIIHLLVLPSTWQKILAKEIYFQVGL